MSGIYSTADFNLLASLKLVCALAGAGVRDFVISSGSRCAPLVLAVAQCPGLRVVTQVDERSAGFLALGIAKAGRRPVALICTSGTAAANYLPAVVESRMSHTPLIVLTADRPPELRGTGAPQTIDQLELYGRYPLQFIDLPVPCDEYTVTVWEKEGFRAPLTAMGSTSGPVHLNVPFREPLIPDPNRLERIVAENARQAAPKPAGDPPKRVLTDQTWDDVAARLAKARRGIIICGPQNARDELGAAVSELAERLGFPVLADVASQVRFGPHHGGEIISHFDMCLRHGSFADDVFPDSVLRLGGLPTSKVLNEWLASAPPHEHILISESDDTADPSKIGTLRISVDVVSACTEISQRALGNGDGRREYLNRWQMTEALTREIVAAKCGSRGTEFGGSVVTSVIRAAPEETPIFLSNSLPIRWAEFFAGGDALWRRILCNRGANGIDGIVSTAAGVAAALARPTILIIGDIALLHDLNGLAAVRQFDLPLKIVLLNNDGGGIFSFLPIAAHQQVSESLVAMPHGRDFGHAAALWNIPYQSFESVCEFESAFTVSLANEGPQILEYRSTRNSDLAATREIEQQVARALGGVH